jgi:hypothetical protein
MISPEDEAADMEHSMVIENQIKNISSDSNIIYDIEPPAKLF